MLVILRDLGGRARHQLDEFTRFPNLKFLNLVVHISAPRLRNLASFPGCIACIGHDEGSFSSGNIVARVYLSHPLFFSTIFNVIGER